MAGALKWKLENWSVCLDSFLPFSSLRLSIQTLTKPLSFSHPFYLSSTWESLPSFGRLLWPTFSASPAATLLLTAALLPSSSVTAQTSMILSGAPNALFILPILSGGYYYILSFSFSLSHFLFFIFLGCIFQFSFLSLSFID